MASSLKSIKVWGQGGPNPPKVAYILEELGVPYEVTNIPFADLKGADYTKINPNGRIPAIYDPNTDLTLWESGAIVLYLIDRYDTDHKLSFKPGSKESYLANQWLFYQATGQGPYYGQAVWFKVYHSEPVQSAVDRYVKEINRVTAVLDGHLQKQKAASSGDGPWLVGDKCSYADIAFVPWQTIAAKLLDKSAYNPEDYPNVKNWIDRLTDRKSVKKVTEDSEKSGH